MLVGNILSVQWPEVGLTGAASTLAIGIFHYIFRKRFLEISLDPKAVAARGISVRFWDFLFYASFGFVVTRSVAIARRAARILLPHRAVGRRDALGRPHRAPAGDWLGDGGVRVDAGHVFLGPVRLTHGRGHRLHVRDGPGPDGPRAAADRPAGLSRATTYRDPPRGPTGFVAATSGCRAGGENSCERGLSASGGTSTFLARSP